MTLVVHIEPDIESRIRHQASVEGLSAEELAARRIEEADLLWRVRSAAPDTETRKLHRLLRKQKAGGLDRADEQRLAALLDERELRGAERLADLARLSRLTGTPVAALMDQLGIAPIPAP